MSLAIAVPDEILPDFHLGDHTDHLPDPQSLYFADESDNNSGVFDAKTYWAAGHTFYACKATQGLSGSQAPYAARAKAAHDAGLHVIHYHFAEPAAQFPIAQIQFFLRTIEPYFKHGDRAVLDIEVDSLGVQWTRDGSVASELTSSGVARTVEWARSAFAYLKDHGHPAAPLYTGLAFLQAHGKPLVPPSKALWIADYGRPGESLESIWRDVESSLPGGNLWALQYTDGVQGPDPHTLPGINGLCDVSKLA